MATALMAPGMPWIAGQAAQFSLAAQAEFHEMGTGYSGVGGMPNPMSAFALNPDAQPFSKLNAEAQPFVPSTLQAQGGKKFNAGAKPFAPASAQAGTKFNADAQPFAPSAQAMSAQPRMTKAAAPFHFNVNAKPFEVTAVAHYRPAQAGTAPEARVEAVKPPPGLDAAQPRTPPRLAIDTNLDGGSEEGFSDSAEESNTVGPMPGEALTLPGVRRRDLARRISAESLGECSSVELSPLSPEKVEMLSTPAALAAAKFLQRNAALLQQSTGATGAPAGLVAGPPATAPPLSPGSAQLSPTSRALRSVRKTYVVPAQTQPESLPSPAAAAALKFIRRSADVIPQAFPQLGVVAAGQMKPHAVVFSPAARSTLTTASTGVVSVLSPSSSKSLPLTPS